MSWSIIELSNTGAILSGAKGYTSGGLSYPSAGIAMDGSGNVWAQGIWSVAELMGAGVPVVTPLSVGVKNNTLGTRP